MNTRRYVLAVSLSVILAAVPAAAAPIGISWNGDVWSVNTGTGSASLIGASGFARVNSLASNAAGVLYAVSDFRLAGSPYYQSQLLIIDGVTGGGSLIADLTGLPTGYSSVRGLAFSDAGTLFAMVDTDPDGNYVGPDSLYTIDVVTGAATAVGATGLIGLQSLSFGPGGLLYSYDLGDALTPTIPGLGLLTVNTSTGATMDVNPSVADAASIQTLALGPGGVFYGAGNGLYVVDSATGATTLVGTGWDVDMRGLAFTPDAPPDPVPEPASLSLLALGLAVAARFARSRRR